MKHTADGFIDPKSLTPEQLYKLQSDTWGQGYDIGRAGLLQAIESAELTATMRERKRIIKLLEELMNVTKSEDDYYRSAWLYDAIALIKGDNK